MTDTTIRCRCGYTVNGHCSRCDSPADGIRLQASPLSETIDDTIAVLTEIALPSIMVSIVIAFLVLLFAGCPGQSEETAPGDPETCCACLYDAFPAVGEPCIYESANSCQGHVKAGVGPDTWGVCLAELCGDVCDGVGPFDVIRWEP